MGRHIAFFNIPAVGHVYPTIAVVAELVRRGHRVSYASIDRRAGVLREAGATVVPYRSLRPADTDPDVRVPERASYISQSLLSFLDEAVATLPQIEPAFAGDLPDVVVYDRMSFAARVFATKYGLPTIQLWPMLVSNENWSMANATGGFDDTHPTFVAYLEKLDAFLAANGVSTRPEEFLTTPVPRRHLAFYPRSFQYEGDRFDDSYAFVGPCVRRHTGNAPWRAPDDGRPVLLVTLGTVYNRHPEFYRLCLDAFADSAWHVVMAVGERTDPASLGPLPANAEVHQVVPQLEVLAATTVFLSHAGMGGVMEALAAGVPQVTAPQTLEQETNADRMTALGLGTRLPAGVPSPSAVRETVEKVAADEHMARQVRAMRRDVLSAGGASRAADIVEQSM